jgi:hypothetical protein
MDYRLLVDLEAIALLNTLPKKTRDRLLLQFTRIRDFPSNFSECYAHDAAGRRVEICIVAGWAIHYWIDFADRHVKVLALRPAAK